MWSDNETSEDLLGFKIHADLLIDVINDDTILPVTIGVFGDWGSGKSSILKIIYENLNGIDEDLKDNTLVLYFNGWIFEGYDDAKAALLESIIKSFAEHKTLGHKVVDYTTKLFKSVDWMRVMGFGFKKIVIPAIAAHMTGGLSLLPSAVQGILPKQEKKDDAHKEGPKKKEEENEIFFQKEKEDNHTIVRTFRDDFKKMIEKSDINKLVVIIDDLDRCTPDRIIENLEAIKLFLNVDKTAFIIGADPRIVRHAIEHRYETDKIENANDQESRNDRIVSDYLEKLIQIPYILPRLSDNEVETYMSLLFCKKELNESFGKVLSAFCAHRESNRYGAFGFGDIQSLITADENVRLGKSVSLIASLSPIITEGLNGNPRQIKRFLNTFTLRNRLVKVAKIQDFKIDVLAKLMVLEYGNSELFRKIYEWQSTQNGEPEELRNLEKHAESGDKDELKKIAAGFATEKIIRWLKVEPKLSYVDLRDYYWIARDQLTGSISGASLVPVHVRSSFKKLMEHGSGTILSNTVKNDIQKLTESELQHLIRLLEKELAKTPENVIAHKVYIEMMAENIEGVLNSYGRIIKQVDNELIPFSLRNEFQLAEKKNPAINSLYQLFKTGSKIHKALNPKK